jgi:glycosyltransferase involved in cell wall biosynthesis
VVGIREIRVLVTGMISVILTVHNDAQHVGSSIESILEQTYRELELIVVDDGSTDGTLEVIAKIQDTRLRLLRPGRVGRGRALNAGIAASSGELIAIQDSDDLSHPRRLELQAQMLDDANIDLLGSTAILLEEGQPLVWSAIKDLSSPLDVTEELAMSNPIPHISLIVRRRLLDEVGGYDARRKVLFDYDLYIRVVARGYRLYRAPVSLAAKRIHAQQQFEKGARARYVFEVLRLQRKAISILKNKSWIVVTFPFLFCYRMMPRGFRMAIQRRRSQYTVSE